MVSLNWIIFVQRAWIIVGIVLSTVLTAVLSNCPRDVSTKAHSCFTAYSFHFQNMQNSPQKLCCGVDVETLRAFCDSYMTAISCVNELKRTCPKDAHHLIDNALVNLDGARAGLQELCSDDKLIETYAMYQTCFTMAGSGSEKCFETYMNSSGSNTNIRFLSKVSTKRMDQFCNDMRNTVECVQKHIQLTCRREEAARLAAILVKPMVRQSTECDYSVINAQQQTTKRPYHSQHAYISDDHEGGKSRNSGSNGDRNAGSDVRHASYVTIMAAIALCAIFIHSNLNFVFLYTIKPRCK